jgi:hypothetical protein
MDNPNDILEGTTPQSPDQDIRSIQAVRLAKRNQHKETMVQSRPDDASPAPASTATATATATAPATAPASAPPSPPRSPSPTLVGSKTNDECIQERYENAVEKGDVIVLDGSPTTDATPVASSARATPTLVCSKTNDEVKKDIKLNGISSNYWVPKRSKKVKSKNAPTGALSDGFVSKKRLAYFDPETNEEVYEWNGVWYLTNGAGPVGKPWRRPRWSQEERDGDWRPTVAEEEEYSAWYRAYFLNVVVRLVLKD